MTAWQTAHIGNRVSRDCLIVILVNIQRHATSEPNSGQGLQISPEVYIPFLRNKMIVDTNRHILNVTMDDFWSEQTNGLQRIRIVEKSVPQIEVSGQVG